MKCLEHNFDDWHFQQVNSNMKANMFFTKLACLPLNPLQSCIFFLILKFKHQSVQFKTKWKAVKHLNHSHTANSRKVINTYPRLGPDRLDLSREWKCNWKTLYVSKGQIWVYVDYHSLFTLNVLVLLSTRGWGGKCLKERRGLSNTKNRFQQDKLTLTHLD